MSDIEKRIGAAISSALTRPLQSVANALRASLNTDPTQEITDEWLTNYATQQFQSYFRAARDEIRVEELTSGEILVEPAVLDNGCALVLTSRPIICDQCFAMIAVIESAVEPGMPVPENYTIPEPSVQIFQINVENQADNKFIEFTDGPVRQELQRQLKVLHDRGIRRILGYVSYLRAPANEQQPGDANG